MKIIKRLFSCVLTMCLVFNLFVPIASAVVVNIENGDEIKKDYFRNVAFGNALKPYQTYSGCDINVVNGFPIYCLERGKPCGDVTNHWDGEGNLKNSDYWKAITLIENLPNTITRTLLHGYPNNTDDYKTGASENDMLFATQVLLWEFTSGARNPQTFDYGLDETGYYVNEHNIVTEINRKEMEVKYRFSDAFNFTTANPEDRWRVLTNDGETFTAAKKYHDKLLNAVINHSSKPKDSKSVYLIDGVGTYSFDLTGANNYDYTVVFPKNSDAVTITAEKNKLNIKVNKPCEKVVVKAVTKDTFISENCKFPVLIESGGFGHQRLIAGVLEDPGQFGFWIQSTPKLGGIGIIKEDTNGNPVPNVTFNIFNKDGSFAGTMVTGDTGIAQYGYGYADKFELTPGDEYFVQEDKNSNNEPTNNPHLIAKDTKFKVQVEANTWKLLNGYQGSNGYGGYTDVYYETNEYGAKDSTTGGVVFSLKSNTSSVPNGLFGIYKTEEDAANAVNPLNNAIYKTEGNGEVYIPSIPSGKYWIRNLGSSKTNVVSGALIPIKVYPNIITRINYRYINDRAGFVNEIRGAIGVKKTDLDGKPVSDAVFGIYNSYDDAVNNKNMVSDMTTSSNGIATYGGTRLGLFSLIPNTDYYVKEIKAPNGYELNDDILSVSVRAGALSFASPYGKGEPNIQYVDRGGYGDAYSFITIYGIGDKTFYAGSSKNASGQRDEIHTLTKDSATVRVTPGKYYDISMSANTTNGYDGISYSVFAYSGCEVRLNLNGNYSMVNAPRGKYGGLGIKKTDSEGNALPNVSFGVYSDPSCNTKVTEVTTGSDGIAYYGGTTINDFTLVPSKTYYVKEIKAPDGYILNTNTYPVTIVADEISYVTVVNEKIPLKSDLEIVKKCETGAGGFEFTLTGMGVEKKGVTVADSNDKTIGRLEFTDLEAGTYTVTETHKVGYKPTTPKTVTLVEGQITKVDFENIPIKQKLRVTKTSNDGVIQGWKFKITGPSYKDGVVLSTDDKGLIELDVIPGVYTVTEYNDYLQDIHHGYYLDGGKYTQSIEVNFGDDVKVYEVKYNNIKREYKILKYDDYGAPVANVKFGVYLSESDAKLNKNCFAELTTDSKGFAKFSGFENKIYYIKEISAPEGYIISPEIYVLDNSNDNWINSSDGAIDLKVTNTIFNSPPTGVNDILNGVGWIICAVAVIGGVYYLFKKKENKAD